VIVIISYLKTQLQGKILTFLNQTSKELPSTEINGCRFQPRPLRNCQEKCCILSGEELRWRVLLEERGEKWQGSTEQAARLEDGGLGPLTPAKRSSARLNQSPTKFLKKTSTHRFW